MPKRNRGEQSEHLQSYVGSQIKARRHKLGLTQAEMGKRAQMTDKFVSRVETRGENLSLHSLAAFAGALNCQAGDLLPRSNTIPTDSKLASQAKALIETIDSRTKKTKQLKLVVKILAAIVEVG